jgi:hypothetical protein
MKLPMDAYKPRFSSSTGNSPDFAEPSLGTHLLSSSRGARVCGRDMRGGVQRRESAEATATKRNSRQQVAKRKAAEAKAKWDPELEHRVDRLPRAPNHAQSVEEPTLTKARREATTNFQINRHPSAKSQVSRPSDSDYPINQECAKPGSL